MAIFWHLGAYDRADDLFHQEILALNQAQGTNEDRPRFGKYVQYWMDRGFFPELRKEPGI